MVPLDATGHEHEVACSPAVGLDAVAWSKNNNEIDIK